MTEVLAFVGSLRKDSLNLALAKAVAASAPEGVTVTLATGLDTLPFYNQDLDTEDALPAGIAALRAQIAAADAVFFFAPPNNGTISAVLKNVLDWGSRPYGASPLSGKPAAIAGIGHNTSTSHGDLARGLEIAGAAPLAESGVSAGVDAVDESGAVAPAVLAQALATLATLVG